LAIQEKNNIDQAMFRAYDIRGIVDENLTENSIYAIGRALGSLVLQQGERSILLGRDGRLSGSLLSASLAKGILSTGCDVIDCGMLPTPVLYYATHVINTRSGVMLTGSHNPKNHNGLKMMVAGKTLAESDIQALYQTICQNNFLLGEGFLSSMEMIERYMQHVRQDVRLSRPLKVVVDCGNGVAGIVVPALYRLLGCEVYELYCEVDGHFPHHHPDPSQPANLQDLIKAVQHFSADVGLAFDGDGDRLGVVTPRGEIIWPDRQLMLFAQSVLAHYPGRSIIYDVKCTYHLEKFIKERGGVPLMWKTGHSLIKSKLAEIDAVLAGEMSGHIFFKDRWYGFDDAIYAGARLLEIIADSPTSCAELFDFIPNSINTPELKIMVNDHEKFSLMKKLISAANFHSAEKITIDGLRVNFAEGWGLIRPSNTTPCLVLRFEANSETVLKNIQNLFRSLLVSVQPDLELPF